MGTLPGRRPAIAIAAHYDTKDLPGFVGANAASGPRIYDDHTPFVHAGVPAIDLIDFDYRCFHRSCDDLGQVSMRSLGQAGRAVEALVRSEEAR